MSPDYMNMMQYGAQAPSVENMGGLNPMQMFSPDVMPTVGNLGNMDGSQLFAGGGATPTPRGAAGMLDSFGGWLKKNAFDSTNSDGTKTQGFGSLALQAGGGLLNSYLGMRQFGLAKKAFKENKRQFNMNFDAQAKSVNSQMSDRQAARVAAGYSTTSPTEYLKKWGV